MIKCLILCWCFLILLWYSLLPVLAISQGDILFNEVMWMGSSSSSADEWIELYNNTDNPINLSGFVIEGIKSGGNDFILSDIYNIQSRSFFLISNYNVGENTILNVNPNIVDTSVSLSNSTLSYKLKDENGNIIDEINGFCGGINENNLKASMAKKSHNISNDCNNWANSNTAVNILDTQKDIATPGYENIFIEDAGDSSGSDENEGSGDTVVPNNVPVPIITLQSSTQTSGILTLKTNVTGENSYDADGDSIRCDWNYGDGYMILDNCNPTYYTYSGVGIYEMVLSVSDIKGSTSSASLVFYVYDKLVYGHKIRINEIYGNPSGEDIDEWIELYNYSDTDIDLQNYYIQVNSTTKKYLSGTIAGNTYTVLKKQDYNFTIPNSSGGYIKLWDINDELIDDVQINVDSIENVSIAYEDHHFIYLHPTPNTENIMINNNPVASMSIQGSGKTQEIGSLSVNTISDSTDQDGDELSCDWDFGDGYKISDNCNPNSHIYNVGEYDLQLIVRDIFDATGATSIHISVEKFTFGGTNQNNTQDIKDVSINITDKNILQKMQYCPIYNSGDIIIENVDFSSNKTENFMIKNNTGIDLDLNCVVFFDNKKKRTFAFSKMLMFDKSIKIYAKELGLNFLQNKDNYIYIFNAKNEQITYRYVPYIKKEKTINIGSCISYDTGDIIIKSLDIEKNADENFVIYNNTATGIDLSCLKFSDGKRIKSFGSGSILDPFVDMKIYAKDLKLNFYQKKDNILKIINMDDITIAEFMYIYQKHIKVKKEKSITKKESKTDLQCNKYYSGDIVITDISSGNVILQNNTNDEISLKCLKFDNGIKSYTGANVVYSGSTLLVPLSKIKIGTKSCKYEYVKIYSYNEVVSEYILPCVKLPKKEKIDGCAYLLGKDIDIIIKSFNKDKKSFTISNNTDVDIPLQCIRIMYKDKLKKPDKYILHAHTTDVLLQKYFNINVAKTKGDIKIMTVSGEIIDDFSWDYSKKKKKEIIMDVKNAFKNKVKSGTKIVSVANIIVGSGMMSSVYVIAVDGDLKYKLKLQKGITISKGDKIYINGKIARSKGNMYVIASNINILSGINDDTNDYVNNNIGLFIISKVEKIYKKILGNNIIFINHSSEVPINLYNDVYVHGQVCGRQKTYTDICLVNGEKVILKNIYKHILGKGDLIDVAGVVIPYGDKFVIAPNHMYSVNIYSKTEQENDRLVSEYYAYVERENNKTLVDRVAEFFRI